MRAGDRWQPGAPTRIHIGASDDWTPAKPCVDLGEAMAARGEPVKVTVYPDSHHGFDAPGGDVVHRTDVPNGVNPGQGVHVGANPVAREKVPEPALRAALAALTGTLGEPAIEFLLHRTPVTLINFGIYVESSTGLPGRAGGTGTSPDGT